MSALKSRDNYLIIKIDEGRGEIVEVFIEFRANRHFGLMGSEYNRRILWHGSEID